MKTSSSRPRSRPAPVMLPNFTKNKSPEIMKILRDINKAKQKQADRKAHKMMSFRRPLKGETVWNKSPVNTMKRLQIHYREMGSPEPLSPKLLPPSSLMIPRQVRPPNPRAQSIFARVYNDDDYVQVAPRPIKGLEIDSDVTSDWSIPSSIESHTRKMEKGTADINSLAYSYPPPSIKFLHKKSSSPRKLKFKRKTVAASFHPRRRTLFKGNKVVANNNNNDKGDMIETVNELDLDENDDEEYIISTSTSHIIENNEQEKDNNVNNVNVNDDDTTTTTNDDFKKTEVINDNDDNDEDDDNDDNEKDNKKKNNNDDTKKQMMEENDKVDLLEKKNDDHNEENDKTKTDKIDDDASKKTTTSKQQKRNNKNVQFFYDTRKFIYPENVEFDLKTYKQLYQQSKIEKKLEAIPWKAYWKYSNSHKKVTLHKVDILTGNEIEV